MRNWAAVGLAWLALGLCWGVLAGDQFTFDPTLQPQFRVAAEQADNSPVAPVIDKPFFVFFTAGPRCGPCIRWEANEQAKVLKAGYSVVKVDIGNPGEWNNWVRYYNINTGPRFFLVDRKDLKAVKDKGPWVGFTAAITLIQAAEGKRVLAPADHSKKVTRDQVSCLYLWEALCLHDDTHGAQTIRPE